jgi:hypothetical protein
MSRRRYARQAVSVEFAAERYDAVNIRVRVKQLIVRTAGYYGDPCVGILSSKIPHDGSDQDHIA